MNADKALDTHVVRGPSFAVQVEAIAVLRRASSFFALPHTTVHTNIHTYMSRQIHEHNTVRARIGTCAPATCYSTTVLSSAQCLKRQFISITSGGKRRRKDAVALQRPTAQCSGAVGRFGMSELAIAATPLPNGLNSSCCKGRAHRFPIQRCVDVFIPYRFTAHPPR